MEDCRGHGKPACCFRIADSAIQRCPVRANAVFEDRSAKRCREMSHGLGDPVEHQANAHAGGEEHREPSEIAVVRCGFRSAETDSPERREDEADADDHEDIAGQQEEPVEIAGQEVPEAREGRLECRLKRQRQEGEKYD